MILHTTRSRIVQTIMLWLNKLVVTSLSDYKTSKTSILCILSNARVFCNVSQLKYTFIYMQTIYIFHIMIKNTYRNMEQLKVIISYACSMIEKMSCPYTLPISVSPKAKKTAAHIVCGTFILVQKNEKTNINKKRWRSPISNPNT